MSFRENLRETLDFIDMEQKELAAKTGLSTKTIENYVKKDASIPTADKAVLIAKAIGVTVEYLVTGKKNPNSELTILLTKHKEIIEILSKLNYYNYEVISSMAEMLLNLQAEKKPKKT